MKILFLDIDGPMVPRRAWIYNKRKGDNGELAIFDPCATAMLITLLNLSEAKLVISSTWRLKGYERCARLLEDNGISAKYLHEDWHTHTDNNESRGDQIRKWLEKHPDVSHYVAVDDGYVDIEHLVKCSNTDGLMLEHFQELAKWLEPDLSGD